MSSRCPEPMGRGRRDEGRTSIGAPSLRAELLALMVPLLVLGAVWAGRSLGDGVAFAQTAQRAPAPSRQADLGGMPGDEARVPTVRQPRPTLAPAEPWKTG